MAATLILRQPIYFRIFVDLRAGVAEGLPDALGIEAHLARRVVERHRERKAAAPVRQAGEHVEQRVEVIPVPGRPGHLLAQLPVEGGDVGALGEIEQHGAGQLFEQAGAALLDIEPGALEVARKPGIGDGIVRPRSILHQAMELALRVAVEEAAHIPAVFLVHADQQIPALVIAAAELARGFSVAADPVLGEHTAHGRVDAVSELLVAGRGRGDLKFRAQPRPPEHIPENKLRRRRAADIPVAHKKYLGQMRSAS